MKVVGKYNKIKVFAKVVEEEALKQIRTLADFEPFKNCKIRIMPDVHAGASCTIGTTMTITDKIIPNMVGVDIGCGMEVTRFDCDGLDFDRLDAFIRENIPSGMNARKKPHDRAGDIDLSELKCADKVKRDLARRSVGTLGGGNHFIEIDADNDNNYYLVVHSGSRHLGLEVANYYQKEAYKDLCGVSPDKIKDLIRRLKEQGRRKEISSALSALSHKAAETDPDMAYCEKKLFDDYIHDMRIIQRFADLNRKVITEEILNGMGFFKRGSFTTVHNYIDVDNMILRKGAVSAKKGEKLLIPLNMRDGALICTGKGNADWNESAPHGAGRVMSRTKATKTLSLEKYRNEMKGIYSTCISKKTLDESPMAYKSFEDIASCISPTVKIVKRILPIYNFKAEEEKRY